MSKSVKIPILFTLLVLVSAILYGIIGYKIQQSDFSVFISTYLLLFAIYYKVYQFSEKLNFTLLFAGMIVLRLIFFPSWPALSNDFYRFIWDGELMISGINPYAHTPNELISHSDFMMNPYWRTLYHGMGELSQNNYSCYPTVNQFLFAIPSAFSDYPIVHLLFFRAITLLADIGTVWVGIKILKYLDIPVQRIWLFAFNPLIIIELTGNVHFEGVMIFLVISSFYLILKNNWIASAILLALSAHVKLIPLILIPVFYKKFEFRKFVAFAGLTLIVTLLLAKPFIQEPYLSHYFQSLKLYFGNFEFNASIFYLIREIGFYQYGYDVIQLISPYLTMIIFVLVVSVSVLYKQKSDKNLAIIMFIALFIYYLFGTTVHPWYITLLFSISIFTEFKSALIWTLLIPLTYSAYIIPGQEIALFIWLEYLLVFVFVGFELFKKTNGKNLFVNLFTK